MNVLKQRPFSKEIRVQCDYIIMHAIFLLLFLLLLLILIYRCAKRAEPKYKVALRRTMNQRKVILLAEVSFQMMLFLLLLPCSFAKFHSIQLISFKHFASEKKNIRHAIQMMFMLKLIPSKRRAFRVLFFLYSHFILFFLLFFFIRHYFNEIYNIDG